MDPEQSFQQHRRYLHGLAYRMLGSVADAEDILQEAWLRWYRQPVADIGNPRAYLTTIVSRLCLDRLGEARQRRETYIGPWLPEPVVESNDQAADPIAADVTFALMLALERLSPLERAAFLLHDIFDFTFAEVAAALDRSEDACRQLARRARRHIRRDKPRFAGSAAEREQLAATFFRASRDGDVATLQQLLVEQAVLHSDGGGQRLAARRLIRGVDKIGRLFAGLARKFNGRMPLWSQPCTINGEPGLLTLEADGLLQATSVHIVDGLITDIYVVRNPDKLTHLLALVPPEFGAGRVLGSAPGPAPH